MTDKLSEDALADLRAAMYQQDDDTSAPARPALPGADPLDRGIMSMPALSAEVRRLRRENEEKDRFIRRLDLRLRRLELELRRQSGALNDVRYDLNDKMDRF